MKEYSAGAILYTKIDNEINYLLIKDFHGNWGFPKGHLEGDETFRQSALREIKEEVGIEAELIENFKRELVYPIINKGIEKHSLYYVGEYHNQTPVKQEEEVQQIQVLPYEQALELLTFDNMKKCLKEADKFIKSL